MGQRKHITVELEQDILERIAQHNDNLYGWLAGGFLVPTEPDADERNKTVAALFGARDELVRLLVNFAGADEERLLRLAIAHDDAGSMVAIGQSYRVSRAEPSKLELLRMEIATFLVEIEELLPRDQWVLSLVARHKTSDDRHIFVSADDGEQVISAIRRLLDTVPPLKDGDLIAQAPKTL